MRSHPKCGGALVVIALVAVVVFGTGMFGSKDSTILKVEAPKWNWQVSYNE